MFYMKPQIDCWKIFLYLFPLQVSSRRCIRGFWRWAHGRKCDLERFRWMFRREIVHFLLLQIFKIFRAFHSMERAFRSGKEFFEGHFRTLQKILNENCQKIANFLVLHNIWCYFDPLGPRGSESRGLRDVRKKFQIFWILRKICFLKISSKLRMTWVGENLISRNIFPSKSIQVTLVKFPGIQKLCLAVYSGVLYHHQRSRIHVMCTYFCQVEIGGESKTIVALY